MTFHYIVCPAVAYTTRPDGRGGGQSHGAHSWYSQVSLSLCREEVGLSRTRGDIIKSCVCAEEGKVVYPCDHRQVITPLQRKGEDTP